jgi:hypothetical protein
VLRLGGRLAFSVWAARERNPALSLVGGVLQSQGHIPPPDPEAPSAFAMADPGRIRELVVGAGFAEPEIEEVTFRWPFLLKCRTRFGSRCTKRLGRTDLARDTTSRPYALTP